MPRWCVVDSSYLRTEALAAFLNADHSNKALLTEEACMEAHKGNTLLTLASSLKVLSQYRGQVAILRNAAELGAAQATAILPREELIDVASTQAFQEFCNILPQAIAGDDRLTAQIMEHAAGINAHLGAAQDETASLAESIALVIRELPPTLITELRTGKAVSREHAEPIAIHIVSLAQEVYRKHPMAPPVPQTLTLLRETILFRKALSTYLLILHWVAKGGYTGAKPPTFSNDLRDAMQAAWATYFDDFLSTDRKALHIYRTTMLFLTNVFPPHDGA